MCRVLTLSLHGYMLISMNTTIQIRIDQKTKTKAQRAFKDMGLDLSSGVKYLLTRVGNTNSLDYICDFGYMHKYTPQMYKKYEKESKQALKKFSSVKEMFDNLEK